MTKDGKYFGLEYVPNIPSCLQWRCALILKALATLYKSYMSLKIGQGGEGLSFLTSTPSMHYSHDEYRDLGDLFASIMYEAKAKNLLISPSQPKVKDKLDPVQTPCNSFSVLQIVEGKSFAQ